MAQPSTKAVEEAFLAAYDEHADAIFRFCVMKTSDREVARDIAQDTFTKTWDYVRKGESIDNWKAFLFRTTNNLIIDWYRKKKSGSLDQLEEDVGFLPQDDSSLGAEKQAEVNRIIAAIETLDKSSREPVYLRFVEGLPPKDIAHILGVSENVVSVRIHRSVEKLRTLLHTQTMDV